MKAAHLTFSVIFQSLLFTTLSLAQNSPVRTDTNVDMSHSSPIMEPKKEMPHSHMSAPSSSLTLSEAGEINMIDHSKTYGLNLEAVNKRYAIHKDDDSSADVSKTIVNYRKTKKEKEQLEKVIKENPAGYAPAISQQKARVTALQYVLNGQARRIQEVLHLTDKQIKAIPAME